MEKAIGLIATWTLPMKYQEISYISHTMYDSPGHFLFLFNISRFSFPGIDHFPLSVSSNASFTVSARFHKEFKYLGTATTIPAPWTNIQTLFNGENFRTVSGIRRVKTTPII